MEQQKKQQIDILWQNGFAKSNKKRKLLGLSERTWGEKKRKAAERLKNKKAASMLQSLKSEEEEINWWK